MSEWQQGLVLDNLRWNDHLHSLRIEVEGISFSAGQYTRLALEVNGVKVARPYSFVNPPHQQVHEFYFNSVPGGPLSNRLIAMEKGEPILVSSKTAGFLTLDEVPAGRHLWLLATGTAIGPFLSILRAEQPWQRFERVVLSYAVRHQQDLSYLKVLDQIKDSHPNQFTWIPFVSRESVANAMAGRIPAAIDDGSLEDLLDMELDDQTSQVMICGNPEMVKDCISSLKSKGLRKNLRHTPGHITVERYW
ncbi:MAG: ferredoxin--NADP reductase [Motiliproteus sp.]|nr:ferredoxin--NADP reductase [Motiliproteus sp.]MCW9051062.1 ferredoxin--NADP reductase [Motiliproteus sp.]